VDVHDVTENSFAERLRLNGKGPTQWNMESLALQVSALREF
jgi:hypothetical protein